MNQIRTKKTLDHLVAIATDDGGGAKKKAKSANAEKEVEDAAK